MADEPEGDGVDVQRLVEALDGLRAQRPVRMGDVRPVAVAYTGLVDMLIDYSHQLRVDAVADRGLRSALVDLDDALQRSWMNGRHLVRSIDALGEEVRRVAAERERRAEQAAARERQAPDG